MEEINILSESIIKIEPIKEEPIDASNDNCWNAFIKEEPVDEELQPPIAVFIGPPVKQEESCTHEDKDPLASCCDGAPIATIKQEITACSPGEGSFTSEKPTTIQTQQSHSTDLDCIPKCSFSNYDQTTHHKDAVPHSSIHGGKCSICNTMFSGNTKFHKHYRTLTGEKPFQCSICEKTSLKGHLDTHIPTHTIKKPFQCLIFEKTTVKVIWDKNTLPHTGETPFQCPICEKTFTQKGTLSKHMRTHTGEKPFQCTICAMTFTEKGTLDKHMRTHTGEKPFQCSICEKAFTEKGTLSKHMRTHTSGKPFQFTI